MKRFYSLALIFAFLFPVALWGYKNLYIIPKLSFYAPETLLVEWQTPDPTPQGRVYIGEETQKDFIARILDYPVVVREKKRGEKTKHRVLIREIEPNKVYRLRVANYDPFWVEIKYSREYRFKAVVRDGRWMEGVVVDLGPFLGLSTGNTYRIYWKTNKPAFGKVIVENAKGERRVFKAEVKRSWQEVELSGLKPNESYRYKVVVYDQDTTETHYFEFTTLPKKGPYRIAVLGDSRANYHQPSDMAAVNGVNEQTLREIFSEIYKDRPHLVFVTGDLIQGYTDDIDYTKLQYETFLEATWPLSATVPVLPVMGNHDATAPLKESSRQRRIPMEPPTSPEDFWGYYFVTPQNGPKAKRGMPPYMENVYYVSLNDALFVVLNSDYWYRIVDGKKLSQRVDETQREWLKRVLKKHGNRRVFVLFHEPAYPVSRHYGSSLDANPTARDSLWQILVKGGVDVVVNGHEHCYGRILVDDKVDPRWKNPIWEFISGRAGAPLYRRRENLPYEAGIKSFSLLEHYVLFEVVKDSIVFRTKALTGEVIDKGTIK